VIEIRSLAGDEDIALDQLPFSRLGSPRGEYLVAWEEGEPVGHVHLDWARPVPELQDVFVAELHRRRGIATALTAAAERAARDRGHTELALEVSREDQAARPLYEKLGFRPTGATRRVKGTIVLRTGPLDVDDTLIAMVKSLA
jgi:GNAT superfamily N-acetyltransferase